MVFVVVLPTQSTIFVFYNQKNCIFVVGKTRAIMRKGYYNSDLSLWLSVDPLSDKYPSLSPYNYCVWNPLKIVDPNGTELDEWKIDKCGNIVEKIDNLNYDQIHIVDDDGSISASSTKYDYGTISEKLLPGDMYTSFDICGNGNAREIFEFLAGNYTIEEGIPLEWGHASMQDDNTNIVGTSHRERSIDILDKLFSIGYIVFDHVHNHPYGNFMPSGDATENGGDIGSAKYHERWNPLINLYVYTTNYGYIKYNSKGLCDESVFSLFFTR